MTQPNWGVDLKTIDDGQGNVDITPGMVESSGRSLLAESLIRRQTTPRGSVIDAPNDCFDVRDWLSGEIDQPRLQQLQGTIVQHLRRDDRVVDVTVAVTFNPATRGLTITEQIRSSDGPFTLTLALSADTIAIIVAP